MPTSGDLEVITTTAGAPAEPEAFAVMVDGTAHSIGPTDTLSLPALSAGDHEVALGGLPDGCTLEGENPRVISLAPNSTTRLAFQVSCLAQLPPGDLHVTIATFGSGSDPDGYSLLVDDTPGQSVAANGDVTLTALEAGTHFLRLAGLDPICEVRDTNPQTVDVPQTADARFEVTCVPPVSGLIAYAGRFLPDSFPNDIFIRSADGATVRNLTNTPVSDERELTWSPDGVQIAFVTFSRDSLFVIGADGLNRRLLVEGLSNVQALQWSPDGGRLFFLKDNPDFLTELTAFDFASQQMRVVATQPVDAGTISGFCLSPDGSRVAYSVTDFVPDPFTSSIFTVPTAGGTPSLVTSATGVQLTVQDCSPDGTTIVYLRRRSDQRSDIYLVPADGSGPTVNLTNQPGLYRDVTWSPDGGLIAFRASLGSDFFSYDLFTITPAGEVRQLTHDPGDYGGLEWSPDGSRLLYESGLQVYFINFDGTGSRTITNDQLLNDGARWRP